MRSCVLSLILALTATSAFAQERMYRLCTAPEIVITNPANVIVMPVSHSHDNYSSVSWDSDSSMTAEAISCQPDKILIDGSQGGGRLIVIPQIDTVVTKE